MSNRMRLFALLLLVPLFACVSFAADKNSWSSDLPKQDGDIVFRVVMVEDEDEDPSAAGKAVAEKLAKAMGSAPLKAVLVSECFEDREYKEELLDGITSVLPKQIVLGGATYGSFTHEGCTDFDAVCLLGIGGDGIGVSAALAPELGTSKLTLENDEAAIRDKLHVAGAKLAGDLRKSDVDQLLVLMADAHSPKNRFLVEGTQKVVGAKFPITGGSANKNAGQTFIYFHGELHADAAIALMLSGNFQVALSGRKAQDNDAVIATAQDGATEASKNAKGDPLAVMAFNCAGRRGKLNRYEDELVSIQKAIGKEVPLFGCYCAGEIGPVDPAEKVPGALCGGSGWHVMFTVISR
jgi:hypothetical protein